MIICLKTWARQQNASEITVCLNDRLPAWIVRSCSLTTALQVEEQAEYYRLSFTLQGVLPMCCQRCFKLVDHAYHHSNSLIVLRREDDLVHYTYQDDCIVANAGEINWLDVVIDELHLYSPEIPHVQSECDILF